MADAEERIRLFALNWRCSYTQTVCRRWPQKA